MFYQMNPHGQEWSNMYWGHAASRDLVHWVHLPVVLEPQNEILNNPQNLKGGAFSGCAVPTDEEVIFYLTRHTGPLKDCSDTIQEQWMMKSRDMLKFGPEQKIIGQKPEGAGFDFRDPKVTKIGDRWYMVLASSLNGNAAILLYSSKNMTDWEYLHPLLQEGQGFRCFECPDLFKLDGKYVAMGAWMEHTDEFGRFQMCRYYIGDWKEEQLQVQNSGWVDFGSNCYAQQSFEHDGRRIMIGWISDFYGEHVRMKGGAYGSMTLPRELHVEKGRLYQKPAEEIYQLREEQIYQGNQPPCMEHIPGNSYMARLKFTGYSPFSILLGKEHERKIWFLCDENGAQICTESETGIQRTFPADVEEIRELEIFVDRRTVEVYINQGEAAGTKLFYHSSMDGCFIMTMGKTEVLAGAELTTMQSIWK